MKIKTYLLLIAGAAIILSSCGQNMTGNAKIVSEEDTLSYALGVDIANSLKRSSIEELNYQAFVNGMSDIFEEKDLKMDEEKIKPFIRAYFTNLQEEKAQKNLEEGQAFLEENKNKEGIITTESGLQYEILQEGTGKSPVATDKVKCHYHGSLLDGTVFDSSVDKGKPAEFVLNRVIPGWTEGLQLMKEGAKYKFYIPSELAYGKRGSRNIQGNTALIFEVELIEILAPEQKAN
jgi:FKBP-type peptidyl-prolyl cis-trans isomerase FklB